MEPLTIIDDPAAWTAKDYPNLEQACHRSIAAFLGQPPRDSCRPRAAPASASLPCIYIRTSECVFFSTAVDVLRCSPHFLARWFPMQHVFWLSHNDIAELDAAVHKATATGKEIAVSVQHT